MNVLFFVVTLTMSLLAVVIVARPLAPLMSGNARGFANLPMLIIVAVILMAIGLYAVIGRPDAAFSGSGTAALAGPDRAAQSSSNNKVGSVASLLTGLETRLQREPKDAGGWLLLAKSYQRLGRTTDARTAYANAQALGQSDTQLESMLAGDKKNGSTAVVIRGRVSVAADMSGMLNEAATVYVLAKASNGSPMPLAVLRKPVSELPFEFALTDEMSMVRGSGISSVAEIVVSAKISMSGDALQTEPGYEVHSQVIETANSPYLELQIDPDVATNN